MNLFRELNIRRTTLNHMSIRCFRQHNFIHGLATRQKFVQVSVNLDMFRLQSAVSLARRVLQEQYGSKIPVNVLWLFNGHIKAMLVQKMIILSQCIHAVKKIKSRTVLLWVTYVVYLCTHTVLMRINAC
jgi:hypothetical protein